METRQLQPADLDAVAELYLRAYDEPWTASEARAYLEKFRAFEPSSCLVAVVDGAIAGAVIAYSYVKLGRQVIFLQDLFVDPEQRHHGVAKQLVGALRQAFTKQATVSVVPLIKADTRVLNFYNSLGFEREQAFTFFEE